MESLSNKEILGGIMLQGGLVNDEDGFVPSTTTIFMLIGLITFLWAFIYFTDESGLWDGLGDDFNDFIDALLYDTGAWIAGIILGVAWGLVKVLGKFIYDLGGIDADDIYDLGEDIVGDIWNDLW